jgi:NAD(P)-dependent dehydrogenase (short-subunit alcohol dehydrogenase family)
MYLHRARVGLEEMSIAVITGGNSGIGRAAAVALAERGFDVGIVWFSEEERAREAVAECEAHGVRAEARQADLEQVPGADAVVDELAEALGGIDALVNNAGAGHTTPFLELELERFRSVLDLDLVAPFLCAQRAARRMVEQGRGGRIVNVTSVHEHVPLPDGAAYVTAKHALGGLTKQMAFELGEHGILVNSVAPGEIATKMTGQEDEDPRGNERPVPVGRPGDAREVGALIAFLASPENGYVTGQSYVIDGGMLVTTAQTR